MKTATVAVIVSLVLLALSLVRASEKLARLQASGISAWLSKGCIVSLLVESLQGHAGRDALANRFLTTCDVVEEIAEPLARRAARLRRQARRGSAVGALVVAFAEPGGTVLTSDLDDLEPHAEHANRVGVEKV